MDCIIARTAGKLATSPLRTAVATDTKNSITLRLNGDARLAAAAGGVARYVAEAAGMEAAAVEKLQEATLAACKTAFDYLSDENPVLAVSVTQYADRIEVAIAHRGEEGPAMGLNAMTDGARGSGDSHGGGGFGGVDRVQHEARGGESVTRLTKYIGRVAPKV
jgi:hypothetical protein